MNEETQSGLNLLVLVDWTYPCDHQFLSNVYAGHLLERGYSVTWVMRPEDSAHQTVEHHTWNGSDVYVLPTTAFDPVRTYLRYLTGRISTHPVFSIEEDFGTFDVVHVRNDLSMGIVATYLTEQYDVAFAQQLSHLKAETIIESYDLGFENRLSLVKAHFGKRLRRRISAQADVVLPISRAMKTRLQAAGYSTRMEVVPTGAERIDDVPDGKSVRSRYDLEDGYLLLYVGSMTPIRRLEFLFDVLAVVTQTFDVTLLMVGGRSADNRERLQKLASDQGVSSDVVFTGWIDDQNDIRRMIAAADIGLSPFPTNSVLCTNAPIKTLEYMSLGTPVVATETPDQRRVLDRSGAGIATEYNVHQFADAVTCLLSSRETRLAMAKNGRMFLERNRNFAELTETVERAYHTISSREGADESSVVMNR